MFRVTYGKIQYRGRFRGKSPWTDTAEPDGVGKPREVVITINNLLHVARLIVRILPKKQVDNQTESIGLSTTDTGPTLKEVFCTLAPSSNSQIFSFFIRPIFEKAQNKSCGSKAQQVSYRIEYLLQWVAYEKFELLHSLTLSPKRDRGWESKNARRFQQNTAPIEFMLQPPVLLNDQVIANLLLRDEYQIPEELAIPEFDNAETTPFKLQ